MAIDGRDIARQQQKPPEAYESLGVRIFSHALIWIPAAIIVWFAYVSGTWLGGGWLMGLASVASAVLSFGIIWFFLKARRRRR